MVLTVGLLGCNRGPVSLGEEDVPDDLPSGTPDVPGDLPSEPPPDLPPACEPPMLECPDGCVDPLADSENCGECDHRCYAEGEGMSSAGGCMDGECLPTWFGCYPIETEYSCAEVCGGPHGEACVENGCAGATILWDGVWEMPAGCDYEIDDPSWMQHASCDTPISEAFLSAGLPDFGPGTLWMAACCCTRG